LRKIHLAARRKEWGTTKFLKGFGAMSKNEKGNQTAKIKMKKWARKLAGTQNLNGKMSLKRGLGVTKKTDRLRKKNLVVNQIGEKVRGKLSTNPRKTP